MPSQAQAPAFESITDKILQLLKKTKDALLLDLENEFSSVREAIVKAQAQAGGKGTPSGFKDAITSVDNGLSGYRTVVDAIFARVGLDLSQCSNLEDFQNLLGRPIDLLEKLGDSLDGVCGEDNKVDYMKLLEALISTGQDIMELVEGFQKVEMSKIRIELESTFGDFYDDFDIEDFALSILEHILITLLRNAEDVFSEEIKYVKLQVNEIYSQVKVVATGVQDGVNAIRNQIESGVKTYVKQLENLKDDVTDKVNDTEKLVRALFKDAVDDMEGVYNTLAEDVKEGLDALQNDKTVQQLIDAYREVSSTLAKVYSVLDFLGVVGEKKMELRISDKVIKAIGDVGGSIGDALGTVSGTMQNVVSGATGAVNGAISGTAGLINSAGDELTETVNTQLGNVSTAVETVTKKKINLSVDIQDIPAVSLPDYSGQIKDVATAMDSSLKKYTQKAVDMAKGFSYPFTITTFKWGRIERLFTDPVSYFEEIYPVNSIEDAEKLAAKIINLVRLFNPDIPDFNSLRGMLESLLRQLGELALTAAADIRKELWEQVRPLMTMIRKVIDLLQELYETLKRESVFVLETIKDTVLTEIVAPAQKDLANLSKEGRKVANTLVSMIEKIQVPSTMKTIYADIVAPSVADAISKSSAPDPKAQADKLASEAEKVLTAWGEGVVTHLKTFFSEDAWKGRLDNTISGLEATFVGDVNAVKNFLKPSTLSDFSSIGDKASALKDELDISQYIKVVSDAFNDVSIPNPELYYEGFKRAVEYILNQSSDVKNKYKDADKQLKALVSDAAAGMWERVRNKILNPLIRQIKREMLRIIRQVFHKVLHAILENLPSFDILKQEDVKSVRLFLNEAKDRVQDVKNIVEIYEGGQDTVQAVMDGVAVLDDYIDIPIDKKWMQAAKDIAEASIVFSDTEMSYADVLTLILKLYQAIPSEAFDFISDILPAIPKDGTVREFVDFVRGMDYKADLDQSFAIVTILDVGSKKKDDKKDKAGVNSQDGTQFDASALVQLVIFAGEVPSDKKEEKKQDESGGGEKTGKKSDQTGGKTESGAKDGEENKEEEEKESALYCMLIVRGKVELTFDIGKNHTMNLGISGGTGGDKVTDIKDDEEGKKKLQKLQEGVGFRIRKNWDFDGLGDEQDLDAMFVMQFHRKSEGIELFDSKYLAMSMLNYPQKFYLGFANAHPDFKDVGFELEVKAADKKKFQIGYFGGIKGGEVRLKLQDVAFIKEVIKDDVKLNFDTYLLFDLQQGFDFGGGLSLHIDYDLNHKKIGPLTIDTFSLEAGKPEGEDGKLALAVGTTFQVDFAGALVVAIENLGIGFLINYKDKNGDYGDFGLDASLQYPTGIGITVDATAVKGTGIISIDQKTGEFFGLLSLDILKKIGVTGYLLCDPGTAKGHDFSLVVLLSARFSPGIPLGMGFSLTAVGGTVGLNRQISRDAIQSGVRAGTLDQVFFVENPKDHLAEMKNNIMTFFPVKKGQFFFGILGQISFEPIVKCDFGLLLQLPSPTEIIIVGALRVNAAEGIVRINVYFAGGINFAEGMWFDASIVDSEIVGISISGDMAFRLNWGGKKGFLLSIGGFHPAYKPEESLHVGKMNRLAMKLDYSILKISFETYLAVTSNSFQIGARFDLSVGWDEFGLVGYAGFDALFQFNPFLFMFYVCAGVAVKCGSVTLLSIDLSMDVQGPAPWKIAGKASFKILLIPIKVSFSKTWGKDTPDLPSKSVEVFPLLFEQWKDAHNWSVDNTDLTGKATVSLFNYEPEPQEDVDPMAEPQEEGKTEKPENPKEIKGLIVQPDGSLTFNQSAVPLKTKESPEREFSLEKMDICNDAVPSDYDSLDIDQVNGEFDYAENDFAPTLYKLMSIQEKLESPSYVKYNSGFTLNDKERRTTQGNRGKLVRSTLYNYRTRPADGSDEPVFYDAPAFNPEDLGAPDRKGIVKDAGSIDRKDLNPLKDALTSGLGVHKLEAVDRDVNSILVQVPVQQVKPVRPGISRDPGNITIAPGGLQQMDRKLNIKIDMKANDRRDRVSFDRYIATLDRKCGIKTK